MLGPNLRVSPSSAFTCETAVSASVDIDWSNYFLYSQELRVFCMQVLYRW